VSSAATWEVEPAGHTVWQVKASTLCNLRCRYCYEWDRLGDRTRITLGQWRRVLQAAVDYREIRRRRFGIASAIAVLWHGGEPTLLPASYVKDVLALQDEVAATAAAGSIVNAVQSHLANDDETLATMVDAGFAVSASLDFASGVRVDAGGRDAQARALRQLEALLARGVRCGVTVVLGRHNRDRLADIHDRLDALGVDWLRIVPMFSPPASAPGSALVLPADDVVAALIALFVHRRRHGGRIPVIPLDGALRAVIARRADVAVPLRDRRREGESRLVVHPDGTLAAQGGTAAPEVVLGNVFTAGAEEIFESAAYRESLRGDDDLRERHCRTCRYRRACDSRPLFTHPHRFAAGPCPMDARLMAELDACM